MHCRNKLMGANAAGHAARAFEVSHLNEFLEANSRGMQPVPQSNCKLLMSSNALEREIISDWISALRVFNAVQELGGFEKVQDDKSAPVPRGAWRAAWRAAGGATAGELTHTLHCSSTDMKSQGYVGDPSREHMSQHRKERLLRHCTCSGSKYDTGWAESRLE
eukprot:1161311-Pelagomonas_calceolata.AAC.13